MRQLRDPFVLGDVYQSDLPNAIRPKIESAQRLAPRQSGSEVPCLLNSDIGVCEHEGVQRRAARQSIEEGLYVRSVHRIVAEVEVSQSWQSTKYPQKLNAAGEQRAVMQIEMRQHGAQQERLGKLRCSAISDKVTGNVEVSEPRTALQGWCEPLPILQITAREVEFFQPVTQAEHLCDPTGVCVETNARYLDREEAMLCRSEFQCTQHGVPPFFFRLPLHECRGYRERSLGANFMERISDCF